MSDRNAGIGKRRSAASQSIEANASSTPPGSRDNSSAAYFKVCFGME
ncbi:hypothetical protein J2S83_007791 [Bradyrhizobium japonicum]|nr:hypothetical protein [Bradyrhizobium japonicum]MCP1874399.1 hypothetical protein [Bradyrhizobium japonicum]